ncbi:MAG: Tol biopolymer transport system component [Kiritimatiellia bacterium]|jgi:TolB protein
MNLSKLLALVLCLGAAAHAETRLTFDGNNKRDPVFINKGQHLVYAYDETDDLIRAVKIDLDNLEATPEPLFDDDRSHQTEMAFSPDGRYTAFDECTGNLTGKLVIRNLEENKQSEITHGGRGAYRTPTFSPDGQRVIYAFAETGPMQLWSVNLEGQDKKQVTETEGLTHWPSFTPDGQRIVFANTRENNYEIYIRDYATVDKPDDEKKSEEAEKAPDVNEERLTTNRLMDIRPRVSPDGKHICFVSTRHGNYEIYVMNIDGSAVSRITDNEERDDYPSWHPDGQRLAYVSERNGRMDVYLVDLQDGLPE